MTTEAFEKFCTQANDDQALQAAVAACFSSPPTEGASGFDKLAALGKSHGFDFTVQDVQASTSTGNATLSDAELEQVSAGGIFEDFASDFAKGDIKSALGRFARTLFKAASQ